MNDIDESSIAYFRRDAATAGRLPEELIIQKLFEPHESVPRNPLIAEVCYKVGYIDSWGRGVEKITDACEQAGLPVPIIVERTGGIAVELSKSTAAAGANAADTMSGKRRENIRDDPSITIAEMARRIGVTERSVQRNIQKLRSEGLLVRLGGRKEGHWRAAENDEEG